jgi:hypothetical protein
VEKELARNVSALLLALAVAGCGRGSPSGSSASSAGPGGPATTQSTGGGTGTEHPVELEPRKSAFVPPTPAHDRATVDNATGALELESKLPAIEVRDPKKNQSPH